MSQFENYIVSLLEDIFPGTLLLREVPVKKIFKNYRSGMDRYDIVSKKYKIIFECHGQQHEKLVSFGKESVVKAVEKFVNTRIRDHEKEMVARENDWTYVIIWYNDIKYKPNVDIEVVKNKIRNST